jgi:Flp pilus assembly CpaE family ATPase
MFPVLLIRTEAVRYLAQRRISNLCLRSKSYDAVRALKNFTIIEAGGGVCATFLFKRATEAIYGGNNMD